MRTTFIETLVELAGRDPHWVDEQRFVDRFTQLCSADILNPPEADYDAALTRN